MDDSNPPNSQATTSGSSNVTASQAQGSNGLSSDEIARIVAAVGAHFELRPAMSPSSASQQGNPVSSGVIASTASLATGTSYNLGEKL